MNLDQSNNYRKQMQSIRSTYTDDFPRTPCISWIYDSVGYLARLYPIIMANDPPSTPSFHRAPGPSLGPSSDRRCSEIAPKQPEKEDSSCICNSWMYSGNFILGDQWPPGKSWNKTVTTDRDRGQSGETDN